MDEIFWIFRYGWLLIVSLWTQKLRPCIRERRLALKIWWRLLYVKSMRDIPFNKASDVLAAAKELISEPDWWSSTSCAQTYDGTGVLSTSKHAYRFCPLGAINVVVTPGSDTKIKAMHYLSVAFDLISPTANSCGAGMGWSNNNATHAEIMERFDKAIELAKEAKD